MLGGSPLSNFVLGGSEPEDTTASDITLPGLVHPRQRRYEAQVSRDERHDRPLILQR